MNCGLVGAFLAILNLLSVIVMITYHKRIEELEAKLKRIYQMRLKYR